MRTVPTDAERRLWALVRDHRLAGFKFRRQVPIGSYIADVLCAERKLIVELDGSQHAESNRDMERDRWLAGQGFRIVRVWNNDMLARPSAVLETIYAALTEDQS
jgi:very-short-patch-repair endonuclease